MPTVKVYWFGACFRESLVIRLYSEIGQIHLSIEAQCGTPVYLWVTATPKYFINMSSNFPIIRMFHFPFFIILYIYRYHSVPSGPPPPIKLVLDEYNFNHPRRGRAIIINQKNFHPSTGQNKRDGTHVSVCYFATAKH